MASTPQLRIRIPEQTYAEEVGDEYNAFGDLCQYIKSAESCGTCLIDDDACTLCLATASKKSSTCETMIADCIAWYERWSCTLRKRKHDKTK